VQEHHAYVRTLGKLAGHAITHGKSPTHTSSSGHWKDMPKTFLASAPVSGSASSAWLSQTTPQTG
jgi:hypothetical protein